MRQKSLDSLASRHRIPRCKIIAVAAIFALTGCAARTIEDLEAESVEADQEKHFHSLVQQLHRTIDAMQAIFGPLGVAERSGLLLDSVTLSMDISHEQDEDGNLSALLAVGDDESQSVEDKVVMRIDPGATPESTAPIPPLADHYRGYAPCRLPSAKSYAGFKHERLDIMLVQAAMTALDAWLCVAAEADSTTAELEGLTITLTINASRSDAGGLELTLGTFSVGEEVDLIIDRVATVEFTFSQPDD